MFSTSLKITLRTLYREKLYTLINLSGLAVGISCCLILGLYLRSELTYDQHHLNHKNIYRVAQGDGAITSPALGPLLAQDFPEIKAFVRFRGARQSTLISQGDQAYYWDRTYTTDNSVFDIFTHDVLYGDPGTALVEPATAAVSETFSRKYFGDANPLGEIISLDNGQPIKITLVFADLPDNSHLKYDVLFSYNREGGGPDMATLRRQLLFISDYTYLFLPDSSTIEKFKEITDTLIDRHMKEQAEARGITVTNTLWLQPLADIHLHSQLANDLPSGNPLYLYGFAAVAVFILLVACINYMNLATALYAKRSNEVGMHKILGAERWNLVFQFLGEAICFTLISLVLAIFLAEVILNLTPVNTLLNKHLSLNFASEPVLLIWLVGLSLLVGVLSGLYPAFYLSSIVPLSALVGRKRSGKVNIRLRQLLVLIQFTITIGVIACTLLMAAQMRYISNKSLGFEKEHRLLINLRGADLLEKIPTIKNELLKNSHILGVSISDSMMGGVFSDLIIQIDNNDGVLEQSTLLNMAVEENFFDVMGMQIVEGRKFSSELPTDIGTTFVVNETLVKQRGWEEPLGKRIELNQRNKGIVIGVVKDFHFKSLHNQVEPFAMYPVVNNFDNVPMQFRGFQSRVMVLKVSTEELPQTISFLEGKFTEFDPAHPFEFRFLDDVLNQLYLSEQRLIKLTGIFTGICIFVACLGLFGLAAFTTEQRTREIGVRKVLGATTIQIILLLSRGILVLVLIGAVIASLIAYYAMGEWLAGFAYHADINPVVFLLSAVMAAMVAFITLALQALKTAQSNPILALRYE